MAFTGHKAYLNRYEKGAALVQLPNSNSGFLPFVSLFSERIGLLGPPNRFK